MKVLITSYLKPTSSGLFVVQCNILPYWVGQFIPFLLVLKPRTSWHYYYFLNRGSTPNDDSQFKLSTLLEYAIHHSLTINLETQLQIWPPELRSLWWKKTKTLLPLLAVSQNLTIQAMDIIKEEWKHYLIWRIFSG